MTRFLNLEKPRRPAEEPPPPREVANKARFQAAGPPEIGLATDFGEQPFVRCPSCEADNNKMAEKCFNCERPLLGEDVRAWNAAFWERRKAAPPPETETPAAPPPPLSETNRQLAEALAASVAQREKSRLWWWGEEAQDSTPLGLRLLGLIRDGNARVLTALGMLATFLASAAVALKATHPGLRGGAAVVAMLLFVLFVPNTRRRRRWWDWDQD